MRNFYYSKIKDQKWDSEILGLVAAIYKEAGKQEMYLKQRPAELEKLVEIAKIQSTEASNAIEGIVTTSTRIKQLEGIVTTSTRIKQLVAEKTTPKNRDEQEIAGYRDVLSIIHENFDAIPISRNYILQLHKVLYSHMNNPLAGKTRTISVLHILTDIQRYCLPRLRLTRHPRLLMRSAMSMIVLSETWNSNRL